MQMEALCFNVLNSSRRLSELSRKARFLELELATSLMLLLIISGMYRYFVSALTETFQLIPVGGAVFHLDSLLQTMISFLGDFMLLGMRVALPVFCTIMLLNAVLGILAKVAPQMNMFAVGIQLKVFTGLAILFLTIGLLPRVSDLIFEQMKRVMVSFVGGMM